MISAITVSASVAHRPSSEEVVLFKIPIPKMETRNSIFFLLMLFLATAQAAIAMQENLNQIATEVNFRFMILNLNLNEKPLYQVADKVEESKERCCENCHRLVSILSILFHIRNFFFTTSLRWR